MFAAPQIFQDSKENIKSALPLKTNNARKGLKPCSINNFTEPAHTLKSEKSVSKADQSCSKLSLGEKENSKPKIKITKASPEKNEFWSYEKEMMHDHAKCIEPDDFYEDILPMCDRITRADVNNLFLDFSSDMYADEPSDDEPPSPIKVSIDFDIPDFSPTLPEFICPSFDDYDLEYIPLPDIAF